MAQQKINENQTDFSELYVGGNKVAVENQLPDFSQPTLWVGIYYMGVTQSASLSQSVSSQKNGIILVWSRYASGTAFNDSFNYIYVPKWHIANFSGGGITMVLGAGSSTTAIRKYVYVSDTLIAGNAVNDAAPNNQQVLRAVIGY